MIAIISPGAADPDLNIFLDKLKAAGAAYSLSSLSGERALIVSFDSGGEAGLMSDPCVARIYGGHTAAASSLRTQVTVGNIVIGGEPILMAGPCAVESYDILRATAESLKEAGAAILRGGAFKPRSSPYSFQGLGEEGLFILRRVGDELKMPVISEMVSPDQRGIFEDCVDIVQIGARNMYNYELLKTVGRMKKPVMIKRHPTAGVSEWLLSAEYALSEGNRDIILCERGSVNFGSSRAPSLDAGIIAAARSRSPLPVIVDPSHAAGAREMVFPLAMAGMAAGADGLIVEAHIYPDRSVSDAAQTISPTDFAALAKAVNSDLPLRPNPGKPVGR